MNDRGGIYLSLGSNLGDRREHLQAGLSGLDAAGVRPVACSPVYRTEPVGGPAQADFLNLVLEVETALEPAKLLRVALQVEESRGRSRSGDRWGPRTLDIDLLLYRDRTVDEAGLQVPHRHYHHRRFVLIPLAQLAPDLLHPATGLSVVALLERCREEVSVKWHSSPLALPAGGRVESPPAFG